MSHRSGNQGDEWRNAFVPIAFDAFQFVGVRGSSFLSESAVAQVRIRSEARPILDFDACLDLVQYGRAERRDPLQPVATADLNATCTHTVARYLASSATTRADCTPVASSIPAISAASWRDSGRDCCEPARRACSGGAERWWRNQASPCRGSRVRAQWRGFDREQLVCPFCVVSTPEFRATI